MTNTTIVYNGPEKFFTCCNQYSREGHATSCVNHKFRRDLKPCPFCGHEAQILPQEPLVPSVKAWLVRCTSCMGQMKHFGNHIKDVRAAWNHRKP